MNEAKLQIPQDRFSEIYYDPDELLVKFRPISKKDAKEKKKPKDSEQSKFLRVVIQAYGYTIDDRLFVAGSTIKIGTGFGNTFQLPTEGLPNRHKLIQYHKDQSISLKVNARFSGIIFEDEQLTSLQEAPHKTEKQFRIIELKKGSRACIEHGTIRIYIEEVNEPEKVAPVPIFKSMADPAFMRWLIASLALHLLLLLLVKLFPVSPPETALEEIPEKYRRILVASKDIKPYQPMTVRAQSGQRAAQGTKTSTVQQRGGGREGEGARASQAEGRRGKSVAGAKGSTGPSLSKVRSTGVLGFLNSRGAVVDSSISDTADAALSKGRNQGRYGLQGESKVREGKGLTGSGSGGGNQTASIGQGLGTKGRGGGAKGTGLADFGTGNSKISVTADIDRESVYAGGGLTKEQILKVIQEHKGRIQLCYERETQKNPNLGGKISMAFVIGGSGIVSSASVKESTMGNASVESCISRAIRRIPFPEADDPTEVSSFPFNFSTAGR
ncbi:MAG: AgmX/PglI C-terminal domain-containing protein [Bdellovibrionales bacterium]|nr:AgmX/PglI C-terminal domain-containing protein [Bdellovibrionales bacterium]